MYEILGFLNYPGPNEIKATYHNLIKVVHPDKYADKDDKNKAELVVKILNQAFDNLTNSH